MFSDSEPLAEHLLQRSERRLGARGAVLVELLIAYIPVLFCFLAFWQLSELLVAQMVVARASSAAGRAAVVVLPDDPMFYAGEAPNTRGGKREADVRLAAGMILAASPHLAEDFELYIGNLPEDVGAVEVSVAANFRCDRLRFVCGADGVIHLSATSQHTYHGAKYQYEPTDLSAAATGDSLAFGDASCRDGDPASNGTGGKPGKGDDGGGDDDCPAGQARQPSGRCEATRGNGSKRECKDKKPPRSNGQCSDGTCQNTGKKPNKNRPDFDPNNPCPDPNKPSGSGSGSSGASAGGSGGSGGTTGATGSGGTSGTAGTGGASGAAGNGGAGGTSNQPDCRRSEAKRQEVIRKVQREMERRWRAIQALFPDDPKPLYIGYRGSLARGRQHPDKGGKCWDPQTSDIDFFIAFDVPKGGYRQEIITPEQQAALDKIARQISAQSGVGPKGSAHSTFFAKPQSYIDAQNKPEDPQVRYPP